MGSRKETAENHKFLSKEGGWNLMHEDGLKRIFLQSA